jgi:hypothetical protein
MLPPHHREIICRSEWATVPSLEERRARLILITTYRIAHDCVAIFEAIC